MPLAQTFSLVRGGERLSVVVNHFKSKAGCPAGDGPDADRGDGQGCWNASRTHQARALLDIVSEISGAGGDQDVLVIGDLNAYAGEDPIRTLVAGGLADQVKRFHGTKAYSFVFEGQEGYLDHALASPSLAAQITGVAEWHVNADEPSVLDYNTEFRPAQLYRPTQFRSSDHDPLVVGIALR